MQNVNKNEESDFSDEADKMESNEQLLARIYDTAYLLQKKGLADINIVETDDGKNLIVIILTGVKYNEEEGFIQV
jgi:hypothetical protein